MDDHERVQRNIKAAEIRKEIDQAQDVWHAHHVVLETLWADVQPLLDIMTPDEARDWLAKAAAAINACDESASYIRELVHNLSNHSDRLWVTIAEALEDVMYRANTNFGDWRLHPMTSILDDLAERNICISSEKAAQMITKIKALVSEVE